MPEFYGLGYASGGYVAVAEPEPPPTPPPAQPAVEFREEPDLSVRVDFLHDINPDEALPSPVWTEIVYKLRQPQGFKIRRGRQRELDRVEPGSVVMLLDDPDGELDPDNPDSPYFPDVVPRRRINVGAMTRSEMTPFEVGLSEVGGPDVVGGGPGDVRTTLFDGIIDALVYDYPGRGADATVTLTAYDLLAFLSREEFDLNTFVVDGDLLPNPEHFVRDLMGTILDFVPFADRRDIPPGGVRFANREYDDANVLVSIQELAQADGGNLFAARDGAITYRPPEWAFRPVNEALRFGPDHLAFVDIDFVYDTANVYNVVTVAAPANSTIVSDPPSIRRYGRNPITLTLPLELAQDITARADSFLAQHVEAHRVILRLDLANVIAEWETILGAELWEKVLIEVVFPNGQVREQESLLEGIDLESSSRANWRPAWWLSLAPFDNLVPAASSDFETLGSVGGWVAETNVTVENSNGFEGAAFEGYASRGVGSLALRAIVDGDISARSPSIDGIVGRASYRASAKVSPSVLEFGNTLGHLELEWRDGAESLLSTIIGEDTTLRRLRYSLLSVSARAPAGATKARIRVVVEDARESTKPLISSFVDEVVLRRTS